MGYARKGSHIRKLLSVVFIVLAVIAAAGGGATYYAGTNKFCGNTCHQMKTRYALWRKSSHNQVKCIKCHSEPGIAGEVRAHMAGLNYLKSFIKGTTSNITIFAERGNPARLKSCIYCHPADTLREETGTLKINHASHISAEDSLCTDCHSGMVHGSRSLEEVDTGRVREKKCLTCHIREVTRIDCRGCHTGAVLRN
ncbi:MAG: hypothetical protein GXP49_05210 [Deltaproteobacteria bacterium]|nr:hypothetical protein [Deltaproteobacteria bacterium]